MKKFLIVYYGDAPECVEGFSKDCKRSCKGAIHLNPGRQVTVTEDELKHIKERHKHCLPKLRVISEMKEPEPKKGSEKKSEPKEQGPEKKAPKEEAKLAASSKGIKGRKKKKKKK